MKDEKCLCDLKTSLLSFSLLNLVLFPERLVLQSPQAIKTQNTTEYCAVDDGLKQASQQESKVSILSMFLKMFLHSDWYQIHSVQLFPEGNCIMEYQRIKVVFCCILITEVFVCCLEMGNL